MRITWLLFGLSLLVAYAHSSPVVKREAEAEDLSPLNEVYVVEADEDQAADGDRTDRDKRKIGVVKLGVSNGIINFVFGKLDSFIDSKTKALTALDEANKVKNAAYGIDAKYSATTKFISDLVAAKVQAASGSVAPIINSAQTFLSSAKSGLAGAVASKFAPLSSIPTNFATSTAPRTEAVPLGSGAANLIGSILTSKLGSLSAFSQNGGGASASSSADASADVNHGSFANIGGGYQYSPPQGAYYTA